MHDFHTLMIEHDRLDRLAIELLEIVAGEPDPATALAVRADLSVTLDDHLSKEDGFLYDRLLGNAEEDCYPARVREFHSCFAALAADWKDYLQLWDNECVSADWTGFVSETAAMMERLRARIKAENDLLYPLALQKNHIRLRAAA
ncbi:hemerythrin domain-containing protein [Sphingomonas crocodyli]|nr:hemerythrin domain-containing protein [Sphingomonas crocodyli]